LGNRSTSAAADSAAGTIRFLAMDAVRAANSGHPGMPMGMAEIGVAVWSRHLTHNPANPAWINRDRFVLSNGHGSVLLYALLHLSRYDLSIGDLRQFPQPRSRTPGHPELGYTPGVGITTGPLGQGLAGAVGMAIAEKLPAAEFNRDDAAIVDHHTSVFLDDGCLMEGISHEACSLAGTLGLGKLIALYDDNGISIDGHVEGWFTDDTAKRFEAYGWHVIPDVDGHDVDAVDRAIAAAKAEAGKPTIICRRTTIGRGTPNKADSHDSHGSPLGADEIAATRAALGWAHAPFSVMAEGARGSGRPRSRPRGRDRVEPAVRGLPGGPSRSRLGTSPPDSGRPAAGFRDDGPGGPGGGRRERRDDRVPKGGPERHRDLRRTSAGRRGSHVVGAMPPRRVSSKRGRK
jgi:transketolase